MLSGFAKTGLLQPGESETVTVSFTVENMASCDCYNANANGFKGYELDAAVVLLLAFRGFLALRRTGKQKKTH